jgi:hypothetical protein
MSDDYDWQVGDVAMVRVLSAETEQRAFRGRTGWFVASDETGAVVHSAASVVTARPLLVLDPNDVGQMKDLAKALSRHGYKLNIHGPGPEVNIAKAVASLLKQPLPPPPPSPRPVGPAEPAGLGAVVVDACGVHYVKIGTEAEDCMLWRRQGNGGLYAWHEIDVPDAEHVLSEGWSAP